MTDSMDKLINKIIDSVPISIRIDRKDLINQLRGLSNPIIELIINPKNLKTISMKDSYHYTTMRTRQ